MSINKVEVTNVQGDFLSLVLDDVSNGYVTKEIEGLGPVKSNIVSSSFAGIDGQQYQSSSRDVRNVVFQLGFEPEYGTNQTIRSLRSQLYQYFMTGFEVSMDFYMTDGLMVNATGRVETCEPAIFTREPQMNISVICFDPDFIDPTLVELHNTFTTIDNTPKLIQVDGSVKTGLTSLSFTAAKAMSEFTIYHTTPSGNLRVMEISVPVVVGDVVNMCTIKGQKTITLTHLGVTKSILWAVSPQSDWVLLEPGANQFYLNGTTTGPSSAVLVDFNNRYGGL